METRYLAQGGGLGVKCALGIPTNLNSVCLQDSSVFIRKCTLHIFKEMKNYAHLPWASSYPSL